MKSFIAPLILLFALAGATLAQSAAPARIDEKPKLPAVKDILEKYVAAVGGREANEKIKSRVTKGTVELLPMGVKGTFEITAAAPDRNLTKMTLTGLGEFLDGYDGKTAWSVNPIQGSRERTGDELKQAKLTNSFYRELNLDKLYSNLTVKGIEKVNGKETYVVEGTPEGLPPATFYFDVETGNLLRQDSTVISPEGRQQVRTFFEEYQVKDGVPTVTKLRTVLPQAEIVFTTTESKHNVEVQDAQFARPKGQ